MYDQFHSFERPFEWNGSDKSSSVIRQLTAKKKIICDIETTNLVRYNRRKQRRNNLYQTQNQNKSQFTIGWSIVVCVEATHLDSNHKIFRVFVILVDVKAHILWPCQCELHWSEQTRHMKYESGHSNGELNQKLWQICWISK